MKEEQKFVSRGNSHGSVLIRHLTQTEMGSADVYILISPW